jgi:hypothetical protein
MVQNRFAALVSTVGDDTWIMERNALREMHEERVRRKAAHFRLKWYVRGYLARKEVQAMRAAQRAQRAALDAMAEAALEAAAKEERRMKPCHTSWRRSSTDALTTRRPSST